MPKYSANMQILGNLLILKGVQFLKIPTKMKPTNNSFLSVDIMDTSKINFAGNFDDQVQNILTFVRLTSEMVHNLQSLFFDLENVMQHLAPDCHVQPFGSVVTGLGIKTSDADCFIQLPPGVEPSVQHVIQARNLLRRHHWKFTNVFAITAAKVPIVKFLHIPTNFQCDVSFKSPAGVRNSQLIGFLLQYDSRALPLAVLIKYWSKVHKFTGTNLMANYALIMMVIFYLQLEKILPPVCELQRKVPEFMIDYWNTAFDENMCFVTQNVDSLYELMGGFFQFYSTFNYKENIICPYLGRIINRKSFGKLSDIPKEFYLYKQLVSRSVCKRLRLESIICIQDPFEHNRNCTVAVFAKLAQRIIGHFQFAAKKYEEDLDTNFLKSILTQDPNSITDVTVNKKNSQKHVFHNKVKKQHKQNKRGLQNAFNMWFAQKNSMTKGNR